MEVAIAKRSFHSLRFGSFENSSKYSNMYLGLLFFFFSVTIIVCTSDENHILNFRLKNLDFEI
jgi:hypothetical protein